MLLPQGRDPRLETFWVLWVSVQYLSWPLWGHGWVLLLQLPPLGTWPPGDIRKSEYWSTNDQMENPFRYPKLLFIILNKIVWLTWHDSCRCTCKIKMPVPSVSQEKLLISSPDFHRLLLSNNYTFFKTCLSPGSSAGESTCLFTLHDKFIQGNPVSDVLTLSPHLLSNPPVFPVSWYIWFYLLLWPAGDIWWEVHHRSAESFKWSPIPTRQSTCAVFDIINNEH